MDTIRASSEFENENSFIYFFNKDISFNIPLICLNVSIHVDEGLLEGSLSQIFYLSARLFLYQI